LTSRSKSEMYFLSWSFLKFSYSLCAKAKATSWLIEPASVRIYTVTYGNCGFKGIACDFSGNRSSSLDLNYREFLGSCRFVEFFFLIYVFKMKRDVVSRASKKFRHSFLRHPDIFIGIQHLYINSPLWRLIYNNLIVWYFLIFFHLNIPKVFYTVRGNGSGADVLVALLFKELDDEIFYCAFCYSHCLEP